MKVLDMPRSRCAVPGNHWNEAEVSLMDEWFLTYVWSTVSPTLETESPWPLQYLAVGPRQTLGSLGSMQWRTVSEDWHVGITDPNAQVPFSDDGLYTLDYRQTDLDCAKDHRRLVQQFRWLRPNIGGTPRITQNGGNMGKCSQTMGYWGAML